MSVNATSNYPLDYILAATNMFTAITALRVILLLPLCALILYLGHQQWKQRSIKAASHTDVFTYHVAAMELIWVLGLFLTYGATSANQLVIAVVGSIITLIAYFGEMLFHVLTCAERYLAVVHPIIYMGLRNARGVRIRNIAAASAWLLSFGLIAVQAVIPKNQFIPETCLLVFSIIIITFCSLSVLCALTRPGPGEGGRQKEQVDKLKQKAFYTISAITCAVWFWFVGHFGTLAVSYSPSLSDGVKYVVAVSGGWFNLPSSLVLPLLFLHRERKLLWVCFKKKK